MTINRFPLILLLSFVALIAQGCTPKPRISYRYDSKTDFTTFKTFAVEKTNSPTLNLRTLDGKPMTQTLQEAIERELAARGLTPAGGSTSPDLLVRWSGQIEYTQFTGDEASPGVNIESDLDRPDAGPILDTAGPPDDYVVPEQVTQGGLRIDLVNARTNKVVWRGALAAILKPNTPDPERVKRLNVALTELFKHYPPPKAMPGK